MTELRNPRGRGAPANPKSRFDSIEVELDDGEHASRKTEILSDATRSILSRNDSPDLGFSVSLNPYRGCEHGCSYCYARPTHEYLGFSAGLDFETKIVAKTDAARHLRRALEADDWQPETIALSGVTDCYQPVERRLRLTRGCLEVLEDLRNPVSVVTKNHLVTRDVDLLSSLATVDAAAVVISITTLDQALQRVLEPRASAPSRRLDAIRELSRAGVPTGVLVAPVIPGLNDHEMPRILAAAKDAGASYASWVLLRLPWGVADLFEQWLDRHRHDAKDKILHRIESLRRGRRNDSRFGSRMRGEGIFADQLARLFEAGCRKAGLGHERPKLSTASFRRRQPSLFEPV